ncbi:ribosomal-protein-alanine N-acetyltransferase [Paenibacillus phyllosphaerae]|uniref:Ribosomal-protein-alanine N-acetyltransferase n=1 Tax=Paenibacillus phyllosphaerae TaxID=274593 RepID=A0A7W5AWX5_9BACL|nr:GNAT family N-acetyltransferase [Paenibacillus phyllosphaerae]MBB3109989.1 ribosomal-protein-alanine N-acetyltransferase [Paenibacillus phyllosphaerae]
MTTTLTTKRLILRSLDGSAADAVRDYYHRNREFLEAWEIKRDDSFYTMEHHEELLGIDQRLEAVGTQVRLWLFHKDAPETVIGTATLSNIVRGAFQSCYLGYRIDGELANQGLMTEALQALIEHAFTEMGLYRIEANIMPHNEPSLRVVAKLGFYEEGRAIKYLRINGVWEDHIHMVLRNTKME